MPTSKHIFNNDTHTAVLSIELPASEYMPKVEKKLKEYRNKVQLKGFRTGEVPMNFLKAKFGNSILSEEIQGVVNDELNTFIETTKLNLVGSPLPLNKYDSSIQKPQDIKIEIELGFIPEYEVKGISNQFSMPFYAVEIDDETLEKEIETQRKRLSTEFETDVNDIQDGDNVKVILREALNGSAKEDGLSNNEVLVNTEKCSANLKERLLKAMIGEKLIASLDELDADLNINRAKKQYFNLSQPQNCSDEAELEIVEIKRVKKRELNADFFKDVLQDQSIEDYNLFRDKLRSAISDSFSSPAYNIYNRSIFEHLMEQNIELPLPKTFLKRFVEETQMKGKAIQDAQFSELIKQLTWGTITNELCRKHNINVSAEDVEYEMRMAIVRYYGIQISPFHNLFDNQVKKMMEDKETYRKYFEEVQESKLFAELEEQFNKEQKSVSVKEFKEIYDQYFVKQQEKEEAEAEQLDAILDSEEA